MKKSVLTTVGIVLVVIAFLARIVKKMYLHSNNFTTEQNINAPITRQIIGLESGVLISGKDQNFSLQYSKGTCVNTQITAIGASVTKMGSCDYSLLGTNPGLATLYIRATGIKSDTVYLEIKAQ
jgi:hypothetical protein